ncbi:MAG: outer membrane lipoprotein-sorting protein [gamma proteobacterium symbiont of Ctena orbiculata]|uniref:Outer membrane lipoprotein-sorting protein n=1 Tax=Candidatus Thiodiazotropha taylori TaxID=2792791 RepID=A0A944MF00_9GAMM|nr:outer membrane lipoprotein-sorting protein [Candidatus Thiodiazotropha taylori]PUB90253.1 MAG: outer membrane lipoprotein-sorting protein [gamma proteobacterium symbiont of Ctena orbiculata]MBT2989790.1 outer membrane lipoprotein-sorting protein [Candidatus Thiodiazotropha taylori]MBT2995496.1 outer membrane lipoprotein-sorting protein [Candidatus Thiodiazotropha taylori]MBT3002952.1 outer membrane lipoprotein-sorting protein [Candidatus Thiodiazotropha taylori]
MKGLIRVFWLLIIYSGSSLAGESEPEAVALLKKTEALMRSSASVAVYQVDIIRPDWQRSMSFRSHDDMANNRFRMEILSPRKTKGTLYLKVDNILSMYLPKLRRQINISPAMMQDPWMGSDFNNQDLLETDSLINHYSHRILQREGNGDQAIITIESTPSATAKVTWKRLIQRIRGDGIPVEMEYLCEKRANRRMTFDQVKEMDGRLIPTRWTMTPLDQTGKRTVITLESIQFNVPLSDEIFTPDKSK